MAGGVNSELNQNLRPFFLTRDEIGTRLIAQSITKTVGVGKDYATIQEAIDYFHGKILAVDCYIVVDAGTYNENLSLTGIICLNGARLSIQGDTRTSVGYTCVIGSATRLVPGNRAAVANLGTGTVTNALGGGNTWMDVVMSTTNPDFDAAGIVVGDKIRYFDTATNTCGTVTLTAVLNNRLTVAAWAAGMTTLGSAFCFMPNRVITGTIIHYEGDWEIRGFTINQAAATVVSITGNGDVRLSSTLTYGATSANVIVQGRGILSRNYYNSVWESAVNGVNIGSDSCLGGLADVQYFGLVFNAGANLRVSGSVNVVARYAIETGAQYGFYARNGATIDAMYAVAVDTSVIGFLAQDVSHIVASSGFAFSCAYGYYCERQSNIVAIGATAQACASVGYIARTNSYIYANNTNANNAANGANYNPAVSNTENDTFGTMTWT